MNTKGGYVKIWRTIDDEKDFHRIPSAKWIFIQLIMDATWREKQARFHGNAITLERGQVLTGYRRIAEVTGYSKKTVQKSIQHLIKSGRISMKSDNKGSIITINEYSHFQDYNVDVGTQSTTQSTTQGTTQGRTQSSTQGCTILEEGKKGRKKEKKNERMADGPNATGQENQLGIQGLDDPKENELPTQHEEPETISQDQKKQENIEKALWRRGLWWWYKSYWIEAGLNPNLYPNLTPKDNGILDNVLKKLGNGDFREGLIYFMTLSEPCFKKYQDLSNRGLNAAYWIPSIQNLCNMNKLTELTIFAKKLIESKQLEMQEIPENAVDFERAAKQSYLDMEHQLTSDNRVN